MLGIVLVVLGAILVLAPASTGNDDCGPVIRVAKSDAPGCGPARTERAWFALAVFVTGTVVLVRSAFRNSGEQLT